MKSGEKENTGKKKGKNRQGEDPSTWSPSRELSTELFSGFSGETKKRET